MAEATVMLKLTPAEFDLVRAAIRFHHAKEMSTTEDSRTEVKKRNEARTRAMLLKSLIEKIG
jgi:hypothetical protein